MKPSTIFAMQPATARRLVSKLTPTETQIADAYVFGIKAGAIAKTMRRSVKTIEAHLTRIANKLGVSSNQEIARVWFCAQFSEKST